MAAFELALAGETASVLADPALVFGSLAATGILGVTDLFGGDGGEDEPDESAGDGGMFDESEFDDGGGGGDEFAFDDDGGGGGGEFDDFDMDGIDGEDGGGGGAGVTQLENRVDEIEEELSSLSSTVGTVRTENEQIGESVEDIEENVRKLLDIYKMVTKGVNPFVDQKGGGEAMASPSGGGLGLFDDEEEDPAQGSNLDEEVVEAEAEEFFDDDFDEGEEFDEGAEEDAAEDGADDEEEDSGSSGGRSFDELREEYEDGGGWEDEAEDDESDEETEESEEGADDAEEQGEDAGSEENADERLDELVEEETAEAPARETERQTRTVREEVEQPSTTADQEQSAAASPKPDQEKPYLHGIPAGYSNDLLAIEWVEFLVAEGNTAAARHAISYYERVEWIDAAAGDRLRAFLDGQPTTGGESRDAVSLTMDHHAKSLEFVARINGDRFSPVSVSRGRERESVRDRSRAGTITGSAASR